MRGRIHEAQEIVASCSRVMGMCIDIGECISSRQFYQALRRIDVLVRGPLRRIHALRVAQHIEGHIPVWRGTIRKAVTDDFNEWLVKVRAINKRLGQLAIAQTAQMSKRIYGSETMAEGVESALAMGSEDDPTFDWDAFLFDQASFLASDGQQQDDIRSPLSSPQARQRANSNVSSSRMPLSPSSSSSTSPYSPTPLSEGMSSR